MIYLLVGILVLAGVAFRDIPQSEQHPRFWSYGFWSVIGILVLMAGLRYRIGFDTVIMDDQFNMLPTLSESGSFTLDRRVGGRHAPIYSICRTLGLGMWPIQLFCAAVLNISVGWMIRRYTRNWFVAIGLYLCFAYIPLNFEIMWQGLAVGFIITGIEDLRKGNLKMFYLKLLLATLAHLSAITLVWLPLIRLQSVRRWLRPGWRLIIVVVAVILTGYALRFLLLSYPGYADDSFIVAQLRLTSSAIHKYARWIFIAPPLNYKGILSHLLIYVIIPVAAAVLLNINAKHKAAKPEDAYEDLSHHATLLGKTELLSILITLFVVLQFSTLFMELFRRLSNYFIIFACVGGAASLSCIKSRIGKFAWGGCAALAVVLCLYNYYKPPKGSVSGHLYEIYYPYSTYIDKGLSHHREWLIRNYVHEMQDRPMIEEKDFYFHPEPYNYYLDPPICDTTRIDKIPYYY